MRIPLPTTYLGEYRVRMLASIATALALVLAVVKLWPAPENPSPQAAVYEVGEREVIEIEEVQPTRQSEAKPPPPAPPIPILVPDDVALEDEEIEFSDNLLDVEESGDDALLQEGDDEPTANAPGPTVGPKTVRFVEPEYTRAARRNRVRAELVVAVMIDERGQVQNTEVVERFLLDKDGSSKTPVNSLGYGLEESALSAADRWIFRPARKDGRPVASRTTLTFTFGVDA